MYDFLELPHFSEKWWGPDHLPHPAGYGTVYVSVTTEQINIKFQNNYGTGHCKPVHCQESTARNHCQESEYSNINYCANWRCSTHDVKLTY